MRGRRRIGTEAQIRALVRLGREGGHIESGEGHMIFRTFRLNDRSAEDIMTPLADVVSIPASATNGEAAEIIRDKEFSRCPVFGESPDDVQGLLIARDVMRVLADGRPDEVVALVRPPLVVAAETRANELLVEFRTLHQHLAVVQRQGRTVGIVTLEDVLEEIVGEIEDEADVAWRRT